LSNCYPHAKSDGATSCSSPIALFITNCTLDVAGRLVRTARRTPLRLDAAWPWAGKLAKAFARLAGLWFATCAGPPAVLVTVASRGQLRRACAANGAV
jgi:hypothetical protein